MKSEFPPISIKQEIRNGKPVFEIDVLEIINFKSDFSHKLLCDGLTFSLGSACVCSCSFCYVESMVRKHPEVRRLQLAARGLQFEDVVIVRNAPLDIIRQQLTTRKAKHVDLQEPRVIFTSPLVDPAPTRPMADQSAEACRIILELTNWQIRLLSKGSFLPCIAEQIPEHFKHRLIYGVSTGTLDNKLARSFEQRTALVSKRMESLHALQDSGHRTFGMICPSLPQDDYESFAQATAAAVRVDKCEHVWGEALNVRGRSMQRTVTALRDGGYMNEVARVESVCGAGKKEAWEEYARATFLAHTTCIPREKLRFLQYVKPSTMAWWQAHQGQGAVLLGKTVQKANEITQ